MMRSRPLRLAVALIVAVVITAFLRLSLRDPTTTYRQVVVVTANTDVNAALDSSNLAVKRVPSSAVPKGALESLPTGVLAAQRLWEGQYLVTEMTASAPILRPRPEDRVVGVPVTLATAGSLRPGDRVDVFLFISDPKRGISGESRLILSGVSVVTVLNQNAQPLSATQAKASGSAGTPTVAELLVSASQASTLAVALNAGTLTLARYLPDSHPVSVETGQLPPASTAGAVPTGGASR